MGDATTAVNSAIQSMFLLLMAEPMNLNDLILKQVKLPTVCHLK